MELSPELIAAVATGILLLVGGTIAGVMGKLSGKITAVKESIDVLEAVVAAASDHKVTPAEVEKIKKEYNEAKAAWKS